jgi:hypothetical protein
MTESRPSWRKLTSNLKETLNEIEKRLNEMEVRDSGWLTFCELMRILQAVTQESERDREWKRDGL